MSYAIYTYCIDLPMHIHEITCPNREDDGYTIYLNSNLSEYQKSKAYKHAVKHIENGDFEKRDTPVGIMEFYAHKGG